MTFLNLVMHVVLLCGCSFWMYASHDWTIALVNMLHIALRLCHACMLQAFAAHTSHFLVLSSLRAAILPLCMQATR